MKLNFKAPLSTVIAIVVGTVVLVSYFLPFPAWTWLSQMFVSAAVLLAGVAFLLGVANLFNVHLSKITTGSSTALYSAVLLIALFVTLILTLFLGPRAELPMWIFSFIQVPIETSLMAVLAFSLTFAALRLVIHRPGIFSLIFISVVILALLGSAPVFGLPLPFFSDTLLPVITDHFLLAGARGILLGIGLGVVSTGLRILIGADRPFGG